MIFRLGQPVFTGSWPGNESIWLAMAFNVCLVVLARLIVRRSEAAQGSGHLGKRKHLTKQGGRVQPNYLGGAKYDLNPTFTREQSS